MRYFKTYNQFINESKENHIMNVILNSLEQTINEMTAEIETWFRKNFPKNVITDYDLESWRISLIRDMVKAVEKYTLPSDVLVDIQSNKGNKGNIEIVAKIQRDGEVYDFRTEAIYAGGRNIQVLHYRYITKTRLPKTGNSTLTKEYDAKYKKLSKLEKLNTEINRYQTRIAKAEEDVAINSKMNDDEIIQALKDGGDWYDWPTWDEIVKRDAAKNYNNDEGYYNQEMEDGIARKINNWKNKNITWKEKSIVELSKEIVKLQKKIDALL